MTTHAEVARSFVSGMSGKRKGYAMFHDGTRIYSWGTHFVIARILPDDHGKNRMLFTTRDHSQSTSQHKSKVMRAAGWGTAFGGVFEVDNVDAASPREHRDNFDKRCADINAALAMCARALVHNSTERAERMVDRINSYANAFGVEAYCYINEDKRLIIVPMAGRSSPFVRDLPNDNHA